MSVVLHQTEAQFQAAVIEYARRIGWRVAHFHDSRRQVAGKLVGDADAAGFPDLVLVRVDRRKELVFAELKASDGQLKPAQRLWLDDLKAIAEGASFALNYMQVYVWRPSDWPEIEEVLR
jgi:VRR-NUC domain